MINKLKKQIADKEVKNGQNDCHKIRQPKEL